MSKINKDIYVVDLPRIDEVVEGIPRVVGIVSDRADDPLSNVSLEMQDEYNLWCTNRIRDAIRAQSLAGYPAMVYTKYPFDTEESMDLVGLGADGSVVVLDERGTPVRHVAATPETAGYNTAPDDWGVISFGDLHPAEGGDPVGDLA